MVKNPPASAGDTGSSPDPGRSHMPRSNQARAPQLLSLCFRAHEPQLLSPRASTSEPAPLEPVLRNKRSHRNEKPAHHNKEQPPRPATTRESPCAATNTQRSLKKKKKRNHPVWTATHLSLPEPSHSPQNSKGLPLS